MVLTSSQEKAYWDQFQYLCEKSLINMNNFSTNRTVGFKCCLNVPLKCSTTIISLSRKFHCFLDLYVPYSTMTDSFFLQASLWKVCRQAPHVFYDLKHQPMMKAISSLLKSPCFFPHQVYHVKPSSLLISNEPNQQRLQTEKMPLGKIIF